MRIFFCTLFCLWIVAGANFTSAHDLPLAPPPTASSAYRPETLNPENLPLDVDMSMAAVIQMIRGESTKIEGLVVAPGIMLTEPSVPLEHFDCIDLTVLDRWEKEIIPGKTWETKTMAVLTFALGPWRALMLTETMCSITGFKITLTGASTRSLSPAQPRMVAWFVPKNAFKLLLAPPDPLPVWDLLEKVAALGVPVGSGQPPSSGSYLAVGFILDRLQPKDTVSGGMSASPSPQNPWKKSIRANAGMGFPILVVEVNGPLNDPAREQFMHVTWKPSDTSRTRGMGMEIPVGRFSTIGSIPAPSNLADPFVRVTDTPSSGIIASGQRFLNLQEPQDATLIQQRLLDLGLLSGPITGVFNNASRAALARFKQTHGLAGNTSWDLPTQMVLFEDSGW